MPGVYTPPRSTYVKSRSRSCLGRTKRILVSTASSRAGPWLQARAGLPSPRPGRHFLNCRRMVALALTLIVATLAVGQAVSMPAFARRYSVSCVQCHHPFPRVTAFGETFAGNGFRMAVGEEPPDTVATGDELLTLHRTVPLAVRADAQAQLFTNGAAETDLQTPWVLKFISSAPLSGNLSYYFYFLLSERGETAGVEDAFVYWNDIGGRPVDLAVGQFQVSDPLFKRELRLMFEDYAIYRAHIGEQITDLTYDRGLMLMADAAGFSLTAELVNGNGIGAAGPTRRFDDNALKNLFGHVSRDIVPGRARFGAMGYVGRSDGATLAGARVRSETWMVGADATLTAGPMDVNLQYLHREDTRPNFVVGEPDAVTKGGFVEVIVAPEEHRTYGFALYNRIECDQPLLDPRDGGPSNLTRFESAAAGVGYLVARNVRVQFEAGYDMERETGRATVGMTLAY